MIPLFICFQMLMNVKLGLTIVTCMHRVPMFLETSSAAAVRDGLVMVPLVLVSSPWSRDNEQFCIYKAELN